MATAINAQAAAQRQAAPKDELLLTQADLEFFRRECFRWVNALGLKGWSFDFALRKMPGHYRAQIDPNLQSRFVWVYLNSHWKEGINKQRCKQEMRVHAFHEMCELMLTSIEAIASDKERHSSQEIEEEIHGIIRRLENLIFGLDMKGTAALGKRP